MGFLGDDQSRIATGLMTGGLSEAFGFGGDGGSASRAKDQSYLAAHLAKQKSRQGTAYGQRQFKPAYAAAEERLQPYDIGEQALADYQQGNQGWMQAMDYTNSPIYQQLLTSGMDAVNQGAAGSGSLYSGARGSALRDVGQNAMLQANQQNMSAYQNYMGGLQNLMGVGQNTTANLNQLGLDRAGTMSDLKMGQYDYENQLMQNAAQTSMDVAQQQAQQDASQQGALMGMAGTIGGAMLGGPMGASLGGQLGSSMAPPPQQYAPANTIPTMGTGLPMGSGASYRGYA